VPVYDGPGGAGARIVPMTVNPHGVRAQPARRMPPYTEKVLSDAQLADLFAYVKSLPASPSAGRIPLLSRIMSGK